MRLIEQAIELLKLTRNGNELSPPHLSLLQAACNGDLTEQGEVAFAELYADVENGNYLKSWMCGIPNLTQDHQGYVYWRGREVEHYSFRDSVAKQKAAAALAASCLLLEYKAFPVNSRSAISDVMRDAPAGTPWLEALCYYYAFFRKGETVRVVFYQQVESLTAVALEKRDGVVVGEVFEGGYEAYHGTIAHGYASAGCDLSYAQIVELLEQTKLTPEEIHAAIT